LELILGLSTSDSCGSAELFDNTDELCKGGETNREILDGKIVRLQGEVNELRAGFDILVGTSEEDIAGAIQGLAL